jgi:hypothetical protein
MAVWTRVQAVGLRKWDQAARTDPTASAPAERLARASAQATFIGMAGVVACRADSAEIGRVIGSARPDLDHMVGRIGGCCAAGQPQLARVVVADQHELPDGAPGDGPVAGVVRVFLLWRRLPSRRAMYWRAVGHNLLRWSLLEDPRVQVDIVLVLAGLSEPETMRFSRQQDLVTQPMASDPK